MQCRTLDTPAPRRRPERRDHPRLTPCDTLLDSGLRSCRRTRATGSPRRRPPARDATNSLWNHHSLQHLPRPGPRKAAEPPGDTHTLARRGGPPPNLHSGGKLDSGGRLQRGRNRTVRNTRRRRRNRTRTHRTQRTHTTRRNTTLTQATQHGRNRTNSRDGTRRGGRTRIRDGPAERSNAGDICGGETQDRATQHIGAAPSCGQRRKRLTHHHKLELTMEGHRNPPDVLFAFPVLNSRAKATQRRKVGEYKKAVLDCDPVDSSGWFAARRLAQIKMQNTGISKR